MSGRQIGESLFTYIAVRVTTRERLDRLNAATGRNFDETISELITGRSAQSEIPSIGIRAITPEHAGAYRFKIACPSCGWSTTTGQQRTAAAALEAHRPSCRATDAPSDVELKAILAGGGLGRRLCGSVKTRRDGTEIRCRRYDGHELRPGTELHAWWNRTGQSEEW